MANEKRSKLAETLAAADAILARGGRLTYGAMARELGVDHKRAWRRVKEYRLTGRWEHPMQSRVTSPGLMTANGEAVLASVRDLRGRGIPISIAAVASAMGLGRGAVQFRLARLRRLGLADSAELAFDRPLPRAPGPPRPARTRAEPRPDRWEGDPRIKGEIDVQKRREAIDGREEVDDWRTVRAPRSRWKPAPVLPEREARERECGAMLAEWRKIRGRA